LEKAHEAASDYWLRGVAEMEISDTDFRILEALLHKGPLPVNTIGPKVHLTPGSISSRLIDYWKEVWSARRKARTIEECEW
jgi:DNA-binding Lrp family transcriptional regulator